MKFYFILFLLISFCSYATAKDQQVTGMQNVKKLQQYTPNKLKSSDDSSNSKTNQPILEMSNENAITKKFNPSEEISEDLAIPFPVDI